MALAAFLIAVELEEEERNELGRQRRWLRDHHNPFELPEQQFRMYFRLSPEVARDVCNMLHPFLAYRNITGLSVETQVLTSLRFFANGSDQRSIVQDLLLSVSQPSVTNCLRRVVDALLEHFLHEWIKFPASVAEREASKTRFREATGFRGVVGCIDCTHIAIRKPSEHEETFVNHKGFHSLNVQVVCNEKLEILAITSRYSGSTNDNFIFRYSAVRRAMLEKYNQGDRTSWLLGDSGYGLEPWLMTPILGALPGSPEARYTDSHCRARNCVERLFGVLKNTWRCLLRYRTLQYEPLEAAKIVMACAILHNIRLTRNEPAPLDEVVEEVLPVNEIADVHENLLGRADFRYQDAQRIRNLLVRQQHGHHQH
ncbi:putative nuclease HARBI1 [Bacillus rossius redtenbacheri]|uniref:putative nuclease HARBI1 n=1 Tax=Bacillus rossius redtenbacheri TaxID=93214 RepID=UPI002FDCD1C6